MQANSQVQPLTSRIVFWFAFLGPLGNLIRIPGLPASFRFYYLLLLPAIFVYFFKGVSRRTFHHLIILLPVLVYMLVSAVSTYVQSAGTYANYEEGNPLIRFALLIALLVFTVCAGEEAQGFSEQAKLRVATIFMKGYLLSLVVGYILFIGYYAKIFSLTFLAHFEVLVQMGFGLLRFSPGSYPNEYGIVSSFALSVLTLLLVYRKRLIAGRTFFFKKLSLTRLMGLYLLTLGALFLATTRAAYIAYLLSMLYIALSQGGIRRASTFVARAILGALLLLACVQPFFDVLGIFVGGYKAFFNRADLGNGRLDAWKIALDLFLQQPYLGSGFGSADMMHNVYLQLLFGLGIFGFSLLLATCMILFLRARGLNLFPRHSAPASEGELLLHRMRTIGMIHICWFAFSNHNLNHFLTWFVVLLVFMDSRAERSPNPWHAPAHTPQSA